MFGKKCSVGMPDPMDIILAARDAEIASLKEKLGEAMRIVDDLAENSEHESDDELGIAIAKLRRKVGR